MNTIQKYLESPDVTALAKSTRNLYGYALGHFSIYLDLHKRFFSGTGIDMTGPERLKWASENMVTFATHLESKKLSGKSIQQYLTCTKIFLKWAGYPTEFTYKISNEDRQQNKRKHLDRWFTEDDVERCLAYKFENSNGDSFLYRVAVRLLVETGARVGEISTIRPDDIYLDDHYLFIQGKTEPRPVIFSTETAAMLSMVLGRGKLPFADNSLFPEVSKLKAVITKMLEDLGLKNGNDGRGPHTFRHHTATYLFYTGNMRIEDLAFLLGDKVETIREKYLHPTPKMIRDRVQTAWGKK